MGPVVVETRSRQNQRIQAVTKWKTTERIMARHTSEKKDIVVRICYRKNSSRSVRPQNQSRDTKIVVLSTPLLCVPARSARVELEYGPELLVIGGERLLSLPSSSSTFTTLSAMAWDYSDLMGLGNWILLPNEMQTPIFSFP